MHRARSTSRRISAEILTCQICYEKYDGGRKLAKQLPRCSHSFCLACLERDYVSNGRGNFLPCPLCRQSNYIPSGGPSKLVNNLSVTQLLDIVDKRAEENNNSRPVPAPRLRCAGCSVATGTNSVARQLNCSHWVCSSCIENVCFRTKVSVECPSCGLRTALDRLGVTSHSHERSPPSTNISTVHPHLNPSAPQRPPPFNPEYPSTEHHHMVTSPVPAPRRSAAQVSSPRQQPHPHSREATPPFNDVTSPTPPAPPPRTVRSERERIQLFGTGPRRRQNRPALPSEFRAELDLARPVLSRTGQSLPDLEQVGMSPPAPPFRRTRSFASAMNGKTPGNNSQTSTQSVAMRLLLRFGRYSESRLQTGTFKHPSSLCISPSGLTGVTDTQHMTFQIFDRAGKYLSMFPVIGIKGACFLGQDQRVAVATHQGVYVYASTGGDPLRAIVMEHVTSISPHRLGLVVAKTGAFCMLKGDLDLVRTCRKLRAPRMRFLRKSVTLERLQDVDASVDNGSILLLDSGAGRVHLCDERGQIAVTIKPHRLPCGPLQNPRSLATDNAGYHLVTDSRRLLKFNCGGAFAGELDFRATHEPKLLQPVAVTVDRENRIVLSVLDEQNKFSEIRVFDNPDLN